jgi:predicted TIM-barrel fold metal-dependent hydrolase
MKNLGRRSFFKIMGQSAVLLMGLSQGKAFSQTGSAGPKRKYKRIDVDVHMGSKEYSDYLAGLKKSSGAAPAQAEQPEMPIPAQGQGQMSPTAGGELENIDMRLKDMDENGIDMQVISWRNIGCSEFEVPDGIRWARNINNTLAEVVDKYPERFAAFCNIPWQAPETAVVELERAVKELNLKGIKIDSTIKGEYLDQKKFFPIFKKAAELDIPVFLHPDEMPADMIKPYQVYGGLDGAGWGYAAEASLHAIRLVYSGLFDELPNLKIMLGHMGEGVPYWLWRLDSKGGSGNLKKKPSEYIKENFYINTSGMFFHPALICAYMAMGVDHVLFATDFPSESNKLAVEFMDTAPMLSEGDKAKVCQLNAERLFKL